MNILVLGPQGSGKGTQARRISASYGLPHIATGDMLREAMAAGTELGLRVKPIYDAGELVPDDLTVGLIRERLSAEDARDGFVLDGFPRTLAQAEVLDGMLAERGKAVDVVLELVVDDEEVVRRLSGRRTCRQCGHVWHVDFDPPADEGTCDRCSGELFQRDDDSEDTIRHRLDVYADQTSPLIGYYGDKGLLRGVDATGPVEDVTDRAINVLRRFGD